jgi:hypothetical protein
VKYTSAAAFRQALEQRLKNEAAATGLGLARLRKRVAFELFLRRLLVVAPGRWVLKGALALDFRLAATTRSTKDIDLGRDDDEQAATRDIAAAQQLAMDDFFTFAAIRTDELEDTDEFSADLQPGDSSKHPLVNGRCASDGARRPSWVPGCRHTRSATPPATRTSDTAHPRPHGGLCHRSRVWCRPGAPADAPNESSDV